MHHRSFYVTLIGIMLCAVSAFSADPSFVSIFSGTDLSGWRVDCKAADASAECFKVQDGNLVLDAKNPSDNIWLTYTTELTDFVLRLRFRAYKNAVGNSGIQFRDEYVNNAYPRHGFDIASNVPQSTGFIWDYKETWLPYAMSGYKESNFTPHLPSGWEYKWSTDADPWNTYEVSCIGSQVKTVLNGKTIIDWDGGSKIESDGYLAIQAHGKQTFRIDFKDIELADLTKTGITEPKDKRQGAVDGRLYDLAGRRAGRQSDGICFKVGEDTGTEKVLILK